jgi:hypothetical protein
VHSGWLYDLNLSATSKAGAQLNCSDEASLLLMCRPKAVVKRIGAVNDQHKKATKAHSAEPRPVSTVAQSNSKSTAAVENSRDDGGAAGVGDQSAQGTGAARTAVAAGGAAAGSVPRAEVAELVTATNVIGGQMDGVAVDVLPKFATAPAKSACLGLQYDSDDDSEGDN